MKAYGNAFVAMAVLGGVVACGPLGGGNTPLTCADGGTTPTDTNSSCNTLVFGSSATVVTQQVASAAPAAAGGTLANGTYFLTDRTNYTGPGGATGPLSESSREVFSFNNGTLQMATFNPGGCSITRQEGTVVVSSTQITYTSTCGCTGGGCGGAIGFTMSGNTLSLIDPGGTVQTLSKQ